MLPATAVCCCSASIPSFCHALLQDGAQQAQETGAEGQEHMRAWLAFKALAFLRCSLRGQRFPPGMPRSVMAHLKAYQAAVLGEAEVLVTRCSGHMRSCACCKTQQ